MTKLLFALLAISGMPALSEPPSAVTSVVRTADLDLGRPVGQRQLDRRISIAVAEVCGTASNADLSGKNEVRRCRDETFARVSRHRDQLLAAAERGGRIAVTAAR